MAACMIIYYTILWSDSKELVNHLARPCLKFADAAFIHSIMLHVWHSVQGACPAAGRTRSSAVLHVQPLTNLDEQNPKTCQCVCVLQAPSWSLDQTHVNACMS
jgi:hypothetical protein